LTFSGNVLKGDFAEAHAHDPGGEDGHEDDDGHEHADAETEIGYSERASLFVPTGTYAGLEIGVNALQGTLDAHTGRSVDLVGADLKYRWAPDKYRSMTVQAEWVRSDRDVLHEHHGDEDEDALEIHRVRADGAYAFIDWRFAQRWNTGAILETTDLAEEEHGGMDRVGVFGGFQVLEETTMVRLLLRRTDMDGTPEPAYEGVLQLVFSLGPHRAHWF
jgi:hypothetical protein